MICYSGSNTEHYRFKHTKTKVGKSMSPFSVRLMQAVLAIAAAAMVGGSAKQTDQPEEPVKQPQPVAEQVRYSEQPKPKVSALDWQKTECSQSNDGDGFSQALTRLMYRIDPSLSPHQVGGLTSGPSGKLFVDATTRNPQGLNEPLNKADTLCVIASVSEDDNNEIVWRAQFLGY